MNSALALVPSVRRDDWVPARSLGGFAVGLAAGGAFMGASVWIVTAWVRDSLPVAMATAVAVVVLLASVGVEWTAKGARCLPQNRRQIPREVFRRGPVLGPFQFGVELGTGVRTYVTAVTPYLLASGVCLFTTSVATAMGLGAAFGLSRLSALALRYRHRNEPDWSLRMMTKANVPASATLVGWAAFASIVASQ